MKEYLSEQEILKIDAFCKDEIMSQAIKKVLLASVYSNGVMVAGRPALPLRNFALSLALDPDASNEKVGADLRAQATGVKLIELGFGELEKIRPKPVKSPVDMNNPAE